MSARAGHLTGAPTERRAPLITRGHVFVGAIVFGAGPMLGFWIQHGGLAQADTVAGLMTAVGQITALIGTYLALVQLVLMSRSPWLDRTFGMDQLAVVHRILGFATLWLLIGHGIASTIGFAMTTGTPLVEQITLMLTTYPFVLMAVASLALFVVVAVTSVRIARRKLSYETWFGLHLYAYLAIALGFFHQVAIGSDFIGDQFALFYWVGLYAITVALIVVFRLGQPIATSWRHHLQVVAVTHEGPDVVSVYLAGQHLEDLQAEAGQYFKWRFLTATGWWRSHPFSLSAAPNGHWLRITVKALGDDSAGLAHVPVGTRVMIEGPYGVMTGAQRSKRRVLLIAGGIGIAPLRALFESLPAAPGDVTLIYRSARKQDLVLRHELDQIAMARGQFVHYIVGRRGADSISSDPLGPDEIERLVPDVTERDAYVCGPVGLMRRVEDALQELGVPQGQIHAERFAY